MFLHDVGHALDEDGVVVGSGAPGDPLGAGLLPHVVGVLDVQLVEGLNVLVDEGDGDEEQIALTSFNKG